MPQRLKGAFPKVPILILLLALTTSYAQAQLKPQPKAKSRASYSFSPPLDKSPGMQLTRDMAERFWLYENQFIKLLPLNRDYTTQRGLILRQGSVDIASSTAQLTQLDRTYEQAYRQLLAPWQVNRLQKARAELAPEQSFALFMATSLLAD